MIELSSLPPVPEGSPFKIRKIEKVSMPHPYCIGPKHVAYASDHCSGRLDEYAIEEAERNGAKCKVKGCNLPFRKHESPLTLFIEVENNKDLNAVAGLHAYCLQIKEANLGIEGFAFPTRWQ